MNYNLKGIKQSHFDIFNAVHSNIFYRRVEINHSIIWKSFENFVYLKY